MSEEENTKTILILGVIGVAVAMIASMIIFTHKPNLKPSVQNVEMVSPSPLETPKGLNGPAQPM